MTDELSPAPDGGALAGACDECVARAWLLSRMAGHLERARGRIESTLALDSSELIAALGGGERDRLREELGTLDVGEVRARSLAAGLGMICACDPDYPPALRALAAPPAVLHVAGGLGHLLDLIGQDAVAVVGSRRPSAYGSETARELGRGLACAGITIVSGMALGIDSAAHAGALEARARTVAVLPGSADRPYPAGKRALYRRILAGGAAVSELGPGTSVRRWMFLARNRIIAGLAAMTVVVEAGEHSGSLVTAGAAARIGRPVGAVPGRVTTPQAAGANELLAAGACLVRGPQDVLDHLFGAGVRFAGGARAKPPEALRPLLHAIASGHETAGALTQAGFEPERGLAALAALELGGYVRRGPGGRFTVVP
ncbi:MAG TPA: DNA-processing protein DprA [Solirubrobacteraceae bacterium]|nr:DNA-processing protein DprA [Solirubrobacteraceae bacterium]